MKAFLFCLPLLPLQAGSVPVNVALMLYNVADVPSDIVLDAEREIASVFAESGVGLEWQHRNADAAERRELDNPLGSVVAHANEICNASQKYSVVVQLTERFPREYRPKAVAFSLPFATAGVRVTVFYDRVRTVSRNVGLRPQRVLAAMLAHEIGHVLIGTDSHFDTGLMRRSWEVGDFATLSGALPLLSNIETRLMHRRMALWRNRQQHCPPTTSGLEAGGQ